MPKVAVDVTGSTAGLSAALSKAQGEVASFEARVKAIGTSFTHVGHTLTRDLTLPIVGVGIAATDMAVKFQQQMTLVQTQAGASAAEVKRMSAAVLELAKTSASQGPQQLAEGLYHLESVGLRGEKAIRALKTASDAAGMGIADLETVSTALGAAVTSNIKGAQNYTDAMGTLDATIGAGNMRMEDLAAALGNVLGVAKGVGISLPEVGAAMAVLTDRGMDAASASTRLRMTLALMEKPSATAKKRLADLGISSTALADALRGPGGLEAALLILHDAMQRLGDKTRATQDLLGAFGGGRSGTAIMTLVQTVNNALSGYGTKLKQIETQTDTFTQKVDAYHETAQYKISHAWAEIQADLVKAGGAFAPVAVKIANDVAGIANAFDKLSPHEKRLFADFAMAVAAGGPLILLVGSFARATTAIIEMQKAIAATKFAGMIFGIRSVGGAAAGAEAEVVGLRASLLSLRGIGSIVIPIAIYESVRHAIPSGSGPARPQGGILSHIPVVGSVAGLGADIGDFIADKVGLHARSSSSGATSVTNDAQMRGAQAARSRALQDTNDAARQHAADAARRQAQAVQDAVSSALGAGAGGGGGGAGGGSTKNATVPAAWKHALATFNQAITSAHLRALKSVEADAIKAIDAEKGDNKQTAIDTVRSEYQAAAAKLQKKIAAQQLAAAKATVTKIETEATGPAQTLKLAEAAGQPASVVVADQAALMRAYEDEAARLKSALRGTTGKARTEIQSALSKVRSSISSTEDQIASSLQGIAQTAQQNLQTILGTIKDAADYALGNQYYQNGLQTPSEVLLSQMQAQDTAQSLQDALDSANQQLAADIAAGAAQDVIAADRKAVDQANRAIRENDLAIAAAKERAKEDADYAQAQYNLNAQIDSLSKNVGDGSTLQSALNQLLGQFGIQLDSLADPGGNGLLTQLKGAINDTIAAFGNLSAFIKNPAGGPNQHGSSGGGGGGSASAPSPNSPGSPAALFGLLNGRSGGSGVLVYRNGMLVPSGRVAAAADGGFVMESGLAVIHKGETITPAGRGGNTYVVNVSGYMGDKSALIRDIRTELQKITRRTGTNAVAA